MRFRDLPEEQKTEFIRRYYAKENVKSLVEEYGISTPVSRLVEQFPPEVLLDKCEYCGTNLQQRRVSKNYSRRLRMEDIYCPNCMHKPYVRGCKCKYCIEKEELRVKSIKQAIIDKYSHKDQVNVDSLGFDERVYLGALVRSSVKEDLYYVAPYVETTQMLTPTRSLTEKVYRCLLRSDVIVVDPTSSLDCFDLYSKESPELIDLLRAKYDLNIVYPDNKLDLFNEILCPSFYSIDYAKRAMDTWKDIATHECIEYLLFNMQKVSFDFSPGEKTYATFNNMLDDFSVSQIYYIIWRSVREVCHFYMEKAVDKRYAANCVISFCRKHAENILNNGWQRVEYSRLHILPQSEISLYFFNEVIKIGDKGFYHVPNYVDLGVEDDSQEDSRKNDCNDKSVD